MKKILTYIIVITVSVVVGIGIGMFNLNRLLNKGDNIQSDTTTVTVYDTIQVRIPEPVASRSVGIEVYPIVQVPVLLYHSDTITKPYFVDNDLVIPISQRYYKDERYQAWVSGYLPKLDSIIVYNTTHTQTITNTQGKGARNEIYVYAGINYYTLPAMNLELQAGYTRDRMTYYVGAGAITGDALKIYGMAGIRYTLFTKKW